MSSGSERRDQLAANLATVRDRVAAAATGVGRDPAGITIVVVTKFFGEDDVRLLADLGVRHVGENRHQEASAKQVACADLGLTWHFVGSIQSNKAAAVARYADVVESVDRPKLVAGLARGAADRTAEGPLRCLIQVSLDAPGAAGRGGVPPDGVLDLADRIVAAPTLDLGGVMAVAPLGEPPAPAFERLAQVAALLQERHPAAWRISAGMSHDLEEAIRHGATHVRVGSAVLGPRPEIK